MSRLWLLVVLNVRCGGLLDAGCGLVRRLEFLVVRSAINATVNQGRWSEVRLKNQIVVLCRLFTIGTFIPLMLFSGNSNR